MSLGEKIRATRHKAREIISIGSPWGDEVGECFIKKMSGLERDEYQQEVIKRCDKNGNMTNVIGWRAKVVAMCLCDKDGVKQFNNGKEIEELNETDPDALDCVFESIQMLNGIGRNAELEKNSEGEATGNGSSEASPSSSKNPAYGSYLDGSTQTT